MARTVAIGEQDFRRIIENDSFYIDKTDFIKEWWESRDTVTLITRPRRFGKTLTMSMLQYFFSVSHAGSGLFHHLSIWKSEEYQKLQGTYPVIFLSFAGIKADNYEETYYEICRLTAREYRRFAFLMESGCLLRSDRDYFEKVLSGSANESDICSALNLLSEYLYDYYKKKVIILLDEYDTPMQEAYAGGYWEKLAGFMRRLMNAAFKTNMYLERAVMTGITRVGRESVFSDLNHLEVITTTSKKYAEVFGFTQDEVFSALDEFGLKEYAEDIRRWYDGFCIGGIDSIYNPWSVLKFLKEKEFAPYWANTSSNRLIGRIICRSDVSVKLRIEELLHGKSIMEPLDEEIVFSDLEINKSAIWSLLLAGGYLKVTKIVKNRRGKREYELSLTNMEVRMIFDDMAVSWFSNNRLRYSDFSDALLSGDKEYMNEYLNEIAMDTFSFFDTGSKPSEFRQPENFYHGFVLGLTADLRQLYQVTSNRESGYGRYDVLLEPYHPSLDDGIILEFKICSPEVEDSLEDTVQAAIRQILDKNYAAVLEKKCSKDRIRVYGFAFQGKKIRIDGGYLRELEI